MSVKPRARMLVYSAVMLYVDEWMDDVYRATVLMLARELPESMTALTLTRTMIDSFINILKGERIKANELVSFLEYVRDTIHEVVPPTVDKLTVYLESLRPMLYISEADMNIADIVIGYIQSLADKINVVGDVMSAEDVAGAVKMIANSLGSLIKTFARNYRNAMRFAVMREVAERLRGE